MSVFFCTYKTIGQWIYRLANAAVSGTAVHDSIRHLDSMISEEDSLFDSAMSNMKSVVDSRQSDGNKQTDTKQSSERQLAMSRQLMEASPEFQINNTNLLSTGILALETTKYVTFVHVLEIWNSSNEFVD